MKKNILVTTLLVFAAPSLQCDWKQVAKNALANNAKFAPFFLAGAAGIAGAKWLFTPTEEGFKFKTDEEETSFLTSGKVACGLAGLSALGFVLSKDSRALAKTMGRFIASKNGFKRIAAGLSSLVCATSSVGFPYATIMCTGEENEQGTNTKFSWDKVRRGWKKLMYMNTLIAPANASTTYVAYKLGQYAVLGK